MLIRVLDTNEEIKNKNRRNENVTALWPGWKEEGEKIFGEIIENKLRRFRHVERGNDDETVENESGTGEKFKVDGSYRGRRKSLENEWGGKIRVIDPDPTGIYN